MASPNIHENGMGGTTPGVLSSLGPFYCSGEVYFVHSVTGSDSNTGKERNKPLATVVQALTLAADNDIIVLLAGHTENISTTLGPAQDGLTIVGEGLGPGRAKLVKSGATNTIFNVGGLGVQIENIYFPAGTVANSGHRIFSNPSCRVINCYFEVSSLDLGQPLRLFGNDNMVRDCQIVSIATGSRPTGALLKSVSGHSRNVLDNITIDGGTLGWETDAASVSVAFTAMRVTNLDLLGDSDVNLSVTGSTGYLHVRQTVGSSRVVWAA